MTSEAGTSAFIPWRSAPPPLQSRLHMEKTKNNLIKGLINKTQKKIYSIIPVIQDLGKKKKTTTGQN